MDNGLRSPSIISSADLNMPADIMPSSVGAQSNAKEQLDSSIDMGKLGGKVNRVVVLGDTVEKIVENGVALLKQNADTGDLSETYTAIQEAREQFLKGAK